MTDAKPCTSTFTDIPGFERSCQRTQIGRGARHDRHEFTQKLKGGGTITITWHEMIDRDALDDDDAPRCERQLRKNTSTCLVRRDWAKSRNRPYKHMLLCDVCEEKEAASV